MPASRNNLAAEINGWKLLREVPPPLKAPGRGPAITRVIAICPVCKAKKTMHLTALRRRPQCNTCTSRLSSQLKTLDPRVLLAVGEKYERHLAACRSLGIEHEPFEAFVRDFIDTPSLLANDTIVYRDEVSSASPLTWSVFLSDNK